MPLLIEPAGTICTNAFCLASEAIRRRQVRTRTIGPDRMVRDSVVADRSPSIGPAAWSLNGDFQMAPTRVPQPRLAEADRPNQAGTIATSRALFELFSTRYSPVVGERRLQERRAMDDHHDIRRGSVLALRGSVVNAHFPDGLPELYSELRAGPERTAASSSKWSATSTRKPRRASL